MTDTRRAHQPVHRRRRRGQGLARGELGPRPHRRASGGSGSGSPGWAAPDAARRAPTARASSRDDGVARAAGDRRRSARSARPAASACCSPAPTIADPRHRTSRSTRYVRDIVTGQKAWCQLFSEPGAGSDLAGLQTQGRSRTATSGSSTARRCGPPAARSPTSACSSPAPTPTCPSTRASPTSRIDMHQPGVEVRPLREMTGRAMFNEVFLTDARVADDAIIGGLNNGWAVANTTLDVRARRPRRRRRHRRRRRWPRPARSPATSTSAPATSSPARGQPTAAAAAAACSAPRTSCSSSWPRATARSTTRRSARTSMQLHTLERDRPLQQPAAQGGQGGRAGHPRPAATSPSCSMSEIVRLQRDLGLRDRRRPTACSTPTTPRTARRSTRPPATRSSAMVTEHGAVRPGPADLRRHRPDPAQHHRRAGARPPQGAEQRQDGCLQGPPQEHLA